jgi:large subunit ribosomal protein L31
VSGTGPGGYQNDEKGKIMKAGIHPNYREVCFMDLSNNFKFVTRSCVNTKEMVKMEDGRELPLYKLDTSSESHPFYTGTQKSVDNMGGRVERFRNRFGKTTAKEAAPEAAPVAAE